MLGRESLNDLMDQKNQSTRAKLAKALIGPGLMGAGGATMAGSAALFATGMAAPIIPFGVLTAGAGVFTIATGKAVWNAGTGIARRLGEMRKGVDMKVRATKQEEYTRALYGKLNDGLSSPATKERARRALDRTVNEVGKENDLSDKRELEAARRGDKEALRNYKQIGRTTRAMLEGYNEMTAAERIQKAKDDLVAVIYAPDSEMPRAVKKQLIDEILRGKFKGNEMRDLIAFVTAETQKKIQEDKDLAQLVAEIEDGDKVLDTFDLDTIYPTI